MKYRYLEIGLHVGLRIVVALVLIGCVGMVIHRVVESLSVYDAAARAKLDACGQWCERPASEIPYGCKRVIDFYGCP